ncbi:hypothetical protein DKX38_003350 [Salix brachista]|uniref:Coenzyme Q-binding protein COQ10 START domain-containing protein n=1 Tax=Salix brachista TaxID=2182728 RepID=A0A5N5NR79_9ROSI|nr:hypothetical protein DKX38_003350 [Salix brachista]
MPAAAATAIAHWSTPTSLGRSQFSAAKNKNTAILSNSTPTCKFASPPPSSISKVQYGYGYSKRNSVLTGFKPFSSPVMFRLAVKLVKMEIDVPVGVAYNLYSDRESIPRWMPIISSVKVLKDKPDLSRWSLKYEGLGRKIEYSWLARNMQPTPNQKIHWRSLEGVPNSSIVHRPQFSGSTGFSVCLRDLLDNSDKIAISAWLVIGICGPLTVSYEVPEVLVPVATAVQPILENLLRGAWKGLRNLQRPLWLTETYALNATRV